MDSIMHDAHNGHPLPKSVTWSTTSTLYASSSLPTFLCARWRPDSCVVRHAQYTSVLAPTPQVLSSHRYAVLYASTIFGTVLE